MTKHIGWQGQDALHFCGEMKKFGRRATTLAMTITGN